MTLPEVLVKLIDNTDISKKLELVSSIIPTYIPAIVSKQDNNRFKLELLDWSGTCSFLATLSDPDKFIDWLKKKYSLLTTMTKDEIVKQLKQNNLPEKTLAKLLKFQVEELKALVQEFPEISDIPLVTKIIKKPDIRIWYTGNLKFSKVGIPKIETKAKQ